MFGWTITFLIIAIIAGVFGFAGTAGTATAIVKALFAVGLLVFFGLLIAARKSPPHPDKAQAGQGAPGSPV